MIEVEQQNSMRQNFIEQDGRGIPFHLVDDMLAKMPYASMISVALKLLCYTGCRISELQNMKVSNIHENWIYWGCGKNQLGETRKEYLPNYLLKEIQEYRKKHKVTSDGIICIKGKTLSRKFNDEYRPMLGKEWLEKTQDFTNKRCRMQYKYQLKGFRKNFATLLFIYYWRKYQDAGVGVEMTSKRMRHSCREITAYHYIETANQIDAEHFQGMLPFQVIKQLKQKRVFDFL